MFLDHLQISNKSGQDKKNWGTIQVREMRYGHVKRMRKERLPPPKNKNKKTVELREEGKRHRGRPRAR